MMQFTKLFRCFCVAGFVYGSVSSIRWNVKNKHVKIGDDVLLTCNVSNCSSHSLKTWYGGKHYDLLSYNDVSTNTMKYGIESNDTSYHYRLMIKQFNFDDINYEYTCACGFNRYTQMLKLDNFDFVYGYVNDSSKLKDERFIVHVVMKVYPIPTCFFVYKTKKYKTSVNILELVNISGTVSGPFTIAIHASLNVDSSDPKGFINLTCQANSTNYDVLDIKIYREHKDVRVLYMKRSLTFTWLGLAFLIIVLLMVLFIMFMLMRKKMKCWEVCDNDGYRTAIH